MAFAGEAPRAMFGLAPHGGCVLCCGGARPVRAMQTRFVQSPAGAPSRRMFDAPFLVVCSASAAAGAAEHAQWSPYVLNGGTALGIAGTDFAVVAADTRLSEGYSILSRNVGKCATLTSKCVIATGGCFTDVHTLHKTLKSRVTTYRANHDSDCPTHAIAQMLGITLYGRRFFPYYAFNVVAGVDSEGKGAVYTYDAVGSFERVEYAAQGAGQKMIIPFLDNLVGRKNRTDAKEPLTVEQAVNLVKEGFVTAGERDMYTGDAVDIFIVTKDGVRTEKFELKKD